MYWQKTNKTILNKINELIKQCQRTTFKGIGKPEPLKGNLSGWWSRRIDHKHRLVYRKKKKTSSFFNVENTIRSGKYGYKFGFECVRLLAWSLNKDFDRKDVIT